MTELRFTNDWLREKIASDPEDDPQAGDDIGDSIMGDSLQTSVRAKLKLTTISENCYGSKTLRFDCQYDDTIPEDRRFQKATPSGHAELMIDNPAALGQFKLGETYYVDFTNAPKP